METKEFASLLRRAINLETEEEFNKIYIPSIDICSECSEKPDELKLILASIDVLIRYVGISEYWPDDKEPRQKIVIKITRNNQTIEFDYDMSLYDTWILSDDIRSYWPSPSDLKKRIIAKRKVKIHMLYSILSCVSLDYYIPNIFEEFCAEFGYDTDSRKAFDTWQSCLVQSAKLHKIFTDDEISALPK